MTPGGRDEQRGMSLVEVMVSITLMVAIVPIFFPLLRAATRGAGALGAQAQTVDQLRTVVATIGRELRSARCIYEPAPNAAAGSRLRFVTEADNTTYEVTYEITGSELLRQVTGEGVRIAGEDLVGDPNAFRQVSTPRRSVEIAVRVQSGPDSPERAVGTLIAGRNAWRDC